MANKSAIKIVLANTQVVYPSKGDQPPYVRSKMSIQSSPKLLRYKGCMHKALDKKKYASRAEARAAFRTAAKSCKGQS